MSWAHFCLSCLCFVFFNRAHVTFGKKKLTMVKTVVHPSLVMVLWLHTSLARSRQFCFLVKWKVCGSATLAFNRSVRVFAGKIFGQSIQSFQQCPLSNHRHSTFHHFQFYFLLLFPRHSALSSALIVMFLTEMIFFFSCVLRTLHVVYQTPHGLSHAFYSRMASVPMISNLFHLAVTKVSGESIL